MLLSGLLVHRLILAAYGVFVVMGVAMLTYGIYKTATSPTDVDVDGLEVSGATAIVGGLLDLLIGGLGILGALYKKRILLIAIMVSLATIIVSNIIIVVITVMTTNAVSTTAKITIRDTIVKKYGNASDASSVEFTKDIDNHQLKAECCGFAGDASENLFLKSPWYALKNQEREGKPRTVPDSCCLEAKSGECQTSENLQQARDKKLVYKLDCFSKIDFDARFYMWIVVAQLSATSVLQTACIALTMLKLLQPEAE